MKSVRLKLTEEINQEVNQKTIIIQQENWSKYVAAFDYIDKMLIVLSASSSGVYIICYVSVGALIGVTGASFTLSFSLTTGIIKKKYGKKQIEKVW